MPRANLYRRLWLTGLALTLFLVTLIVGNSFLAPARAVRWNMLGYDFRALYIAGTFAREGRSAEFYDLKSVGDFDEKIARDHGLNLNQGIGPIFNPPFFAWIFAPLAGWPYPMALKIWYAISLGCLLLSAGLLSISRVRFSGRNHSCSMGYQPMFFNSKHGLVAHATTDVLADGALILLLMATSLPAVQALIHAQNTFLSLLILTCVVTFWRNGHALTTGILAGLLFYKPQLGAVVALAIMATMGWRAAVGLAITGLSLLLLNLLILPGSLTDFFLKMPVNLRWLQEEHVYAWQRHATFLGFWRTLLQWHQTGPTHLSVRLLTAAGMVMVAIGLGRVIWLISRMQCNLKKVAWASRPCLLLLPKSMGETPMPPQNRSALKSEAIDPVIAATLTAMPLLMPFYFDYDLLLLSIAAVLTATDFIRHGRDPKIFADRWLPTAWVAFSIAMYLNLPITHLTHVSPLVPSLCGLSFLTLRRACHRLKNIANCELSPLSNDIIVSSCAA